MAEKKRLRMRGVKQTPKRLEDDILERSKAIAENPGLLRPMCSGNCRKRAFDKLFKDIEGVARYKDDPDALLKLASRGFDDLARAYAGTISLNAAGKIPMLATANLAGDKVSFAVRGSVGNDKLIGCQYYNDPKLRLLYYNVFIKKNKLHLYSFENGLVCSDDPNMPEDYLYESFWDTPYKFEGDGLECGHEGAVSLNITVKSRNERIHICEDCAKEVSTLQYLVSKLCAVDPLDDIDVSVDHKYHAANESGKVRIEGDSLQKYMHGELNDKTLLASIRKKRLGDLKGSAKATYIIGDRNYGSDLSAFMAAVSGPESEKTTLTRFLEKYPRSLILKNGRTVEILSETWEDNWNDIIEVHTSKRIADRYGERPRTVPSQILEEAYRMFISADIVDKLPEFKRPGTFTRLADSLAKAAKVAGTDMVLKTIGSNTLKDSKSRVLAAAFLIVCDPKASMPFALTDDEHDFADFLVPFAKSAVDADSDRYRDAINTLLTACSSGESV
jgi:hypothetical protein